jgi:hypothetical protein
LVQVVQVLLVNQVAWLLVQMDQLLLYQAQELQLLVLLVVEAAVLIRLRLKHSQVDQEVQEVVLHIETVLQHILVGLIIGLEAQEPLIKDMPEVQLLALTGWVGVVLVAVVLVVQVIEMKLFLDVQMLMDALGILLIRKVMLGIGIHQEDLEA